jgi:hypothetical protein
MACHARAHMRGCGVTGLAACQRWQAGRIARSPARMSAHGSFASIEPAQNELDVWVHHYNGERQQSLGMATRHPGSPPRPHQPARPRRRTADQDLPGHPGRQGSRPAAHLWRQARTTLTRHRAPARPAAGQHDHRSAAATAAASASAASRSAPGLHLAAQRVTLRIDHEPIHVITAGRRPGPHAAASPALTYPLGA